MKTLLVSVLLSFALSTAADDVPTASEQWTPTFKRGVNIVNWLTFYPDGKYADPERFSEKDARWIAERGFDHIRIPLDGSILLNVEGKLIHPLLQPVDHALSWAEKFKLGVVLDLHIMPGAPYLSAVKEDERWTSPVWRETAGALWAAVAEKYKQLEDRLRFEIVTEAGAPSAETGTALNRAVIDAIRAVDKRRVIYSSTFGAGNFDHIDSTYIFKNDPNVHYAFQFYDPQVFALQRVPWDENLQKIDRDIPFPFQINDLDKYFPRGNRELRYNGKLIDESFVNDNFARLANWAGKNNLEVYISEFAVYNIVDDTSTERYIRAVRKACERHGFGWAVWDYNGGFAVRLDGQPTAVWNGLFRESSD